MKRFLQKLLFLSLIFSTSLSFAQVANYTFSETTGTYTSIVGGTQLAVTTGGSSIYDFGGSNISLPTGSRFTFNGVTITSLNMTDDGSLWLNPATTTTGNAVPGPIASGGVATGVIAGMGMDLTNTELPGQVYERRWQDDGTEVIFQWTNAARYPLSTSERFSFQIRINKTNGVIRIVYGNMTTIANSTTRQPQVGLRGSTNADFNNRRLTNTFPDATPNWGAPNGTGAGTSNANTVRFTSAGTCFPTSGLIFIWTPPIPPSNDLVCNATTITCGGTLVGTTINASNSGTGENGTCTVSQSQSGVWYVVAGNGQIMTASLCGTVWDSKISVFSGPNCSTLTCVGGNDDNGPACPGNSASFSFPTSIGTNYYILVHGYSTSSAFSIVLTCVTPCNTTPSTISVNLSNTVTNDVVTYTVTGGDGLVTGYQYSFDNFLTIAGTITTTSNPWNLRLNTINSIVYVRVVTQNGTCNSTISNIVSTTIRCAQPSTYSTQYGDYITNVTFNTINNTTTSDPNNDGYQNFLNLSTTVCKGQPYNVSISGTNAGAFLGFQVWIDFNNNNDFSDAGEAVFTSAPSSTATGTINIPSTASSGNVKMRVVGIYNTTPSTSPCLSTFYSYGEVEEYTINITSFNLATLSITGSLTICNGQSTTLTGNGGGTYNWSNSSTNQSISVSPTTNTSYTITVTNTNGCTASTSSSVNVNPLPTPSISGTLSICNGESTTLTASGGNTYVWSNGSTNPNVTLSPTSNTSYGVTASNTFGCTATSSTNVVVKPIPNIPTLNPDTTICPSDFAVLYGSSNIGTLQWYDASTSGTLLGTGYSYTTSPLLNNTPFYAEAELNGCISSRAMVNVVVDPNCILPIYLSIFDGRNEGRENHLYWITEQEINSSHFEVERSNNGFEFVKIGVVGTDPSQSYNFIDNTPYSGSNYYRLKMVDLDETFSYSSIIYLETKNQIESKVYPNPFEDSLIYTYQSEQNEELEIQVINILGQKVFHYNVNCETCGNYVTINTSNIPSGKYTIRIKHLTSLHETIQTIIKK